MKKHIAILACLLAVFLPAVPIWGQENSNLDNNLTAGITTNISTILKKSMSQDIADIVSKKQLDMIEEANLKINALDRSNIEEWFKNYKAIQEEYSDWIDKDETIYDYFSQDEIDFLFKIVETEVRTGYENDTHFIEQTNVCSVIFNRMKSNANDFKNTNTLIEVLTQPSQFSSYTSGEYRNITPTETTRLACEYVFEFGDTTNGALWFDSTNGDSWAHYHRQHLFTDSIGHSYYK